MRPAGAWLTMAAAVWLGGCFDSEPITGDDQPVVRSVAVPLPVIVSNPVVHVSRAGSMARATAAAAQSDVAYVSLPPDSVPNGELAVVRNARTGNSARAAMAEGGFDPVPVAASAGDSLRLEIQVGGGGTPVHMVLVVPEYRKPRVVRTRPIARKRDVVLNARPTLVFTEPIDPRTISGETIRLQRGGSPVSGRVTVSADGLRAEFEPDQLLAPHADYVLSVTTGVTDLSGEPLEQAVAVEFTTGTTTAVAMVYTDPAALFVVGEPHRLAGRLRTMEFEGILHDDGRVTGRFRLFYPEGGFGPSGTLTCFSTAGDSTWVAGVIEASAVNPETIGLEIGWMAVDNAPSGAGVADQLSLALVGLHHGGLGTAEDFCYNQSTLVTLGPEAGQALPLQDVESGDVVVAGRAPPRPAASVSVSPSAATVAAGDTIELTATVRDAEGRVMYRSTSWSSSDPSVATVHPRVSPGARPAAGLVAGLAQGVVTITASVDGASDAASVTVDPPRPVAAVMVTPGPAMVGVQGTLHLTAWLQDVNGRGIEARAVTWASDNSAVATADADGSVTGVTPGSAIVTATSEGVSGTAAVTVTSAGFVSVTAGAGYGTSGGNLHWSSGHTCALGATGTAYCWGANSSGQVGVGSEQPSILVPTAVASGLDFASLGAGAVHTCGLTRDGTAYCWGNDDYAQSSIASAMNCNDAEGNAFCSRVPLPVEGVAAFAVLRSGDWHTCAFTASGEAYCWGFNPFTDSWSPRAVSGGVAFAALSAGGEHTCGLTARGAAYCWGDNTAGQLGNGTTTGSPVPVAVSGGNTFVTLSAGTAHTCGLTASGSAYCWGSNFAGALGNGSSEGASPVPVAVAGGRTFAALSAGSHTCGLTPTADAYCWGWNQYGQLGDGSTDNRSVPVLVSGGLALSSLSAGRDHTCGVTTDAVLYCWGFNDDGQLGDGTTTASRVPVEVGQP